MASSLSRASSQPWFAGPGQVFGEPLADLESGPSVGLVVELDSESRLERLNAVLQSAGDVHDALEQVAVGDVGEVDVDVDAEVGLGCGDLRPPLEAAGAHVELDLVAWQRVAARAPPRREVVRIGEGPEDELLAVRRTRARWRAVAFGLGPSESLLSARWVVAVHRCARRLVPPRGGRRGGRGTSPRSA